LRDDFAFRCVYCLFRERWYPNGQDAFSVEHVIPQVVAPGRVCDYENLVYACVRCNSRKLANLLLDPCSTAYGIHLRMRDDGTIEGLTPHGTRLIDILLLDDEAVNQWRQRTMRLIKRLKRVLRPSWWRRAVNWSRRRLGMSVPPLTVPPDVMDELKEWFGFPDDLPDLFDRRLRGGNSRPGGLALSYLSLRQQGQLPSLY
jgi:hypothetical protein